MALGLVVHVVVRWGASVITTFAVDAPRSGGRTLALAGRASASEFLLYLSTDNTGRVRVGSVPVSPGETLRIEREGFVYEVSLDHKEERPPLSPIDGAAVSGHAVSVAVHAAILGALIAFVPAIESHEADEKTTFDAVASLEADRSNDASNESAASAPSDGDATQESAAAAMRADATGAMGTKSARSRRREYAVATARPMSEADPAFDATRSAMVDLVAANAETGRFDAPDPSTSDPNALGSMWAPSVGDAWGIGVGLSGVGTGGGGRGRGVGLTDIGGLGRAGQCDAQCEKRLAAGNFAGALLKDRARGSGISGHHVGPISVCGQSVGSVADDGCTTSVNGRLPPQTIQRVVRQNFGRFRLCYEKSLRGNPPARERVSVRFVIGRDGSVTSASDNGSDVSREVVSCVVRAFGGLSFPEPEGGTVNVIYPIVFDPGD